jgi:hypothetical protein
MSPRSTNRFNSREVARALKAARLAGERPERVEIDPATGKMVILARRARRQPATNGMKMARLRLKHVNAFANPKRKNDRLRYYFAGAKAIPLPVCPARRFMAAYAAAEGPEPPTEIGASRTLPGTIDALRQLFRVRRGPITGSRPARCFASSNASVAV